MRRKSAEVKSTAWPLAVMVPSQTLTDATRSFSATTSVWMAKPSGPLRCAFLRHPAAPHRRCGASVCRTVFAPAVVPSGWSSGHRRPAARPRPISGAVGVRHGVVRPWLPLNHHFRRFACRLERRALSQPVPRLTGITRWCDGCGHRRPTRRAFASPCGQCDWVVRVQPQSLSRVDCLVESPSADGRRQGQSSRTRSSWVRELMPSLVKIFRRW
jgi:hypothetical protein